MSKRKQNVIYTVTCLADIPPYALGLDRITYDKKKKEFNSYGGLRCIGWYTSKKKATTAVEENHCNIHECSYKYAVVEKTPEGPYAIGSLAKQSEWWYKWDNEDSAFKPIDKPDVLKKIIGWGIG